MPKALQRAGMSLDDIDLIELNEAFAAQALAVIRELGLDEEITNVNGGAIALGHPLGCTGAKLTVQILHELRATRQGVRAGHHVYRRRHGRGRRVAAAELISYWLRMRTLGSENRTQTDADLADSR